MKTTIRRLRNSMKQILGAVQHGEEVVIYLRKQAIAKIVPIQKPREADKDYGFGMWSDHENMIDVPGYLRKLRKGRQHDI